MTQLVLAYPWFLLLLPLPLLVTSLLRPHNEPRPALVVPFFSRLAQQTSTSAQIIAVPRSGWPRRIALALSWLCVVVALARPQIIEPPLTKQIPTRDTLLAIDLSGSMETADFKNTAGQTIQRLTAVKEVIADFLSRRKGDRVGLIFFGSSPFVQAPFTQDLDVCEKLLAEAQPKMAGPQTAIGDAIGLAINTFQRSPATHDRVLILLTDGNDTSSQVPTEKAAQIARDNHITIHTISVGDPSAIGEDALNIPALQNISSTTGGLYAHADDQAQLVAIYAQLDKLTPQKIEILTHRPRRDIYYWPLIVGLAISVAQQLLQLLAHRHHPWERKLSSPPGSSGTGFQPVGSGHLGDSPKFKAPEHGQAAHASQPAQTASYRA